VGSHRGPFHDDDDDDDDDAIQEVSLMPISSILLPSLLTEHFSTFFYISEAPVAMYNV
jgi:hypothetical protein